MLVTTHYSPWLVRGNAQAKQALDRFLNAADTESKTWTPRVDVREDASRFVILADLPGVDPSTIDVQMDKNVLSLKGSRTAETQEEGTQFTRVERAHGSFERRFTLPESANAEQISATGRNGVLEISIPKKPELAPRRISINS